MESFHLWSLRMPSAPLQGLPWTALQSGYRETLHDPDAVASSQFLTHIIFFPTQSRLPCVPLCRDHSPSPCPSFPTQLAKPRSNWTTPNIFRAQGKSTDGWSHTIDGIWTLRILHTSSTYERLSFPLLGSFAHHERTCEHPRGHIKVSAHSHYVSGPSWAPLKPLACSPPWDGRPTD